MARVAEVGGAKTEIDSHSAAVTTLVLQEISAVLGTHLQTQIPREFNLQRRALKILEAQGKGEKMYVHRFTCGVCVCVCVCVRARVCVCVCACMCVCVSCTLFMTISINLQHQ